MKGERVFASLLVFAIFLADFSFGKKLSKKLQETLEAQNAQEQKGRELAEKKRAEQAKFLADEELARRPLNPGFHIGALNAAFFEYPVLNGRMTLPLAIDLCENDLECGGFSYQGPDLTSEADLLAVLSFEVFFFRAVDHLTKISEADFGWTTYKVNRPFVKVKGRPFHAPVVKETPALAQFKRDFHNGHIADARWPEKSATAVSFNVNGADGLFAVRSYLDLLDFDFSSTSDWVTFINAQTFDFKSLLDERRPSMWVRCNRVEKIGDFIPDLLPERVATLQSANVTKEKFARFVAARKVLKVRGCGDESHETPATTPAFELLRTMSGQPGAKRKTYQVDYSLNEGRSSIDGQEFDFEKIDKLVTKKAVQIRINDLAMKEGFMDARFAAEQKSFSSFLPSDVRAKLDGNEDQRGRKDIGIAKYSASFASAHVGEPLSTSDRDTFRYLAAGKRIWMVHPSPRTPDISCHKQEAGFSAAAAWLETIFPQIVRDRYLGRQVLLIRQVAGEAVYIPAEYPRVALCLEDCMDLKFDFLTKSSILRRGLFGEARISGRRQKDLLKKLRELDELTEDELRMLEVLEKQLRSGRAELKARARERMPGLDMNEIVDTL